MIIVEGVDGSGKTETIKRLGYQRHHLKSLKGGIGGGGVGSKGGWALGYNTVAAYARKIRDAQMMPGQKIAFDRFHLSEAVYGPILRNQQLIDDDTMTTINHMLRDKQIPVILCLPPFETTLANVMKEGRPRPEYQTVEFLKRAYGEFEKLAPFATILYDFTKDPLPGFVDHAIIRVNGD